MATVGLTDRLAPGGGERLLALVMERAEPLQHPVALESFLQMTTTLAATSLLQWDEGYCSARRLPTANGASERSQEVSTTSLGFVAS